MPNPMAPLRQTPATALIIPAMMYVERSVGTNRPRRHRQHDDGAAAAAVAGGRAPDFGACFNLTAPPGNQAQQVRTRILRVQEAVITRYGRRGRRRRRRGSLS